MTKDYIYAFTTYDRDDLLERAIASVPSDEDYFVVRMKDKYTSLAAATNAAIKEALTDYQSVIVCNDDVQLIGHTGNYLHETRIYGRDKYNIVMTTGYNVKEHGLRGITFIPNSEEIPGMFCFCVGSDFIDKIGWFDEQFERAWFEDTDIITRTVFAGYYIAIVAPVLHTKDMDQENIQERDEAYALNAERYRIKWGGYPRHEKYTVPYNKE